MAQEKKSITVLVANDTNPTDYITFLNNIFDVTLVTHKEATVKGAPRIDLVLYTGGEDVTPSIYSQEVGKFTSINKGRDELEQNIYYNYNNVPKLGICRGSQFLTVMAGGKLVQHVTGHSGSHHITVPNYGEYLMTSTHHQMMYPFGLKKSKYEIIAYATNFKSDTYLDGDNKEIDLPMDFLEPEIVEYPESKAFCIQGHPEFSTIDDNTKDLVLMLISRWFDKHARPEKSKSIFNSRPWQDFLEEPLTFRTRPESVGISDMQNNSTGRGIYISGTDNITWRSTTVGSSVPPPVSKSEATASRKAYDQAMETLKTTMRQSMGFDPIADATPYLRADQVVRETPLPKTDSEDNITI